MVQGRVPVDPPNKENSHNEASVNAVHEESVQDQFPDSPDGTILCHPLDGALSNKVRTPPGHWRVSCILASPLSTLGPPRRSC